MYKVTHTYPHIEQEIKDGKYAEYRAQDADVMMNHMINAQSVVSLKTE